MLPGLAWLLMPRHGVTDVCRHADRFICRDKLGTGLSTAAAFLKPVPSSAVLYGSGEGASILSKVRPSGSLIASELQGLLWALLADTAQSSCVCHACWRSSTEPDT